MFATSVYRAHFPPVVVERKLAVEAGSNRRTIKRLVVVINHYTLTSDCCVRLSRVIPLCAHQRLVMAAESRVVKISIRLIVWKVKLS